MYEENEVSSDGTEEIMSGMIQRCGRCRTWKPLMEFAVDNSKATGRRTICRECDADYARAYRNTGAGKQCRSESQARWRQTARGKAICNRHNAAYARRYPERIKCKSRFAQAVRSGKVHVPDKCSGCGTITMDIQAHHLDYSKPFEVQWLCRQCQGLKRRKNRRRDENEQENETGVV